ncbi:TetR/AcrR family transcriptional regulator [Thalassovita aquimarina]|uniref:TetR/AcrR family transcriptional regulator n=1 Tax=Thalassovita aquimarina TaxID=2785917 RepID=A0ABS5HQ51_9RHOB|nr:TetR/AcrR family transcriptional regulator [Thalassovita aquimarina]MBR9651075.1 TetR/AcrR family transcriptional regulator [Thalassovita aquimarina]
MTAKKRLSKSDWLQAGFAALVEEGPTALKAEPLARRLKTTKGSFYWHFADVPAFHAALLDVWEAEALSPIARIVEEESSSGAKLRRLGQDITDYASDVTADKNPERAIRAWAQGDGGVADRVAKVDGLRLNLLSELLRDNGITNPDWARVILGSTIGIKSLPANANDTGGPMGSLVDLVLALR